MALPSRCYAPVQPCPAPARGHFEAILNVAPCKCRCGRRSFRAARMASTQPVTKQRTAIANPNKVTTILKLNNNSLTEVTGLAEVHTAARWHVLCACVPASACLRARTACLLRTARCSRRATVGSALWLSPYSQTWSCLTLHMYKQLACPRALPGSAQVAGTAESAAHGGPVVQRHQAHQRRPPRAS